LNKTFRTLQHNRPTKYKTFKNAIISYDFGLPNGW